MAYALVEWILARIALDAKRLDKYLNGPSRIRWSAPTSFYPDR